jgi:hypothetical protein
MKQFFVTLCAVTSILGLTGNAMALNITPMDSGQNLAQAILGTGITISNVTYTGALNASGYFSDGMASGLDMESGIILTTGTATDADGPNMLDSNTVPSLTAISTVNDKPGDSDLDALIPGYKTYDATVLEFDFESVGGDVYFNYVFASEEYNEYVDWDYNDVFGFFVDGQNIALLPGTTTPVAINTVNNTSNSMYYVDNTISNYAPFDIEYDGFTAVLTASFTDLSAGTHHMKLAIADAGDYSFDAAVFIQAGTFSDTPPDEPTVEAPVESPVEPPVESPVESPVEPIVEPAVPEPSTFLLLGAGLIGVFVLGRKKLAKK